MATIRAVGMHRSTGILLPILVLTSVWASLLQPQPDASVTAHPALSRKSSAMLAGAEPRHPFPQHVAYAPGTSRPDHRTQAQQDDDVRAAYDHWKASYLVVAGMSPDGSPRYRVAFGDKGTPAYDQTVSEGQGYGMLIVAVMAGYDPEAQTIFDGLWSFARAHPSDIDSRLMGYRVPPGADGNNSAFDGDSDIAYALLLADRQWGSAGKIAYLGSAQEVITGILESTIGPASRLPMLGDWVDPVGAQYNQYTPRSSDFMPDHFRAFGQATGDAVWTEVVQQTQSVITDLQTTFSPKTGLLPDFIVPASPSDHTPQPAPPEFLEGPDDGHYFYNAGRDPWRIGTDALLHNDAVSLEQTRKIAAWMPTKADGDPANIKAGYRLDGAPIVGSDSFTTFFVAPMGVAAMTVPSQQQWLNDVYDAVRATPEGYYEDSVTLLCLLVMTGNFWSPSIVTSGPTPTSRTTAVTATATRTPTSTVRLERTATITATTRPAGSNGIFLPLTHCARSRRVRQGHGMVDQS